MIAYEGNENYIFVSYAHKDSDRVIPIIEELDAAGFRIWYDSGIEVGSEWPEYIEDHLLNCERVIVFMTPSCVASPNCRNEINLARAKRKEMLVVYLEPTELIKGMNLQLNSVQAINAQLHPTTQTLVAALARANILQCCKTGWNSKNDVVSEDQAAKKAPSTKLTGGNGEAATMAAPAFAPLLKRAFIFLEDGEWNSADEYCEKVLDQDPECAEAYLGKLMVELRIRKRSDLEKSEFTFDNSNNYKKILRFGNDTLQTELKGYLDAITINKLEKAYKQAKDLMDAASSEEDYKNAAQSFVQISQYKDSSALEKECLQKAEKSRFEALYVAAIKTMKAASTKRAYKTAALAFSNIKDYKDSAKLEAECLQKAEDVHLESLYRDACKLMREALRESSYKEAALAFSNIRHYKDAEKLEKQCLDLAEQRRLEAISKEKRLSDINKEASGRDKIPVSAKKKLSTKILIVVSCLLAVALIIAAIVIVPRINKPTYELINSGTAYEVTGVFLLVGGKLEIPASYKGLPVTHIGRWAFLDRDNLTDITIPDSVVHIGQSAFVNCTNLSSVTIPDSVESIGIYAFSDCMRLRTVTIGANVTSIGENAFFGCFGLANINYNGTKEQWENISKGSSWDYNTSYNTRYYTVHCTDGDINVTTE